MASSDQVDGRPAEEAAEPAIRASLILRPMSSPSTRRSKNSCQKLTCSTSIGMSLSSIRARPPSAIALSRL